MCQVLQSRIRVFTSLFLIAFAGVALQSCGSSGGSSGLANLTLAVQAVKTFHFTWPDASDETEYHLMENPDGASGYTSVATIPANTTSYDLTVFLPERVNASYMLQKCVGSSCSDYTKVATVGSTLNDGIGYFKASNTSSGANFGTSIAFSTDGSTMAVGALAEGGSGAVYVFKRGSNGWAQDGAPIKASNAGSGDYFGYSVALSTNGSVLAVGAPQEDSDAPGINQPLGTDSSTTFNSGIVYLFSNSGSGWTETDYIKGSDTTGSDRFGVSVALSGTGATLAVGAETRVVGGAVYLFSDSSGWAQVGSAIIASNPEANDYFGASVALSSDGSTLVVGAYQEDSDATGVNVTATGADSATNYNSGAVYLYTSNSGWLEQAYIKASNTGQGDNFGVSVSLSEDGSVLAVGASGERSAATGVNDPNQADDSKSGSGAVYLFGNSGSGWVQTDYIKASNTAAGTNFGISVRLSLDGNTLAVGSYGEASAATGIEGNQNDISATYSGAAYLFSNSSGSWGQTAYIKATNTDANDYFGASVALSPDGNTLAVGATEEQSIATGINGNQSDNSTSSAGAVYLY